MGAVWWRLKQSGKPSCPALLANILWVFLAGFWLAISHTLAGFAYCVSIVGIPFGFAPFRLALVCFAPLGKRTVLTVV